MKGRPDEKPSASITATLGRPSARITSPNLRRRLAGAAGGGGARGGGGRRWGGGGRGGGAHPERASKSGGELGLLGRPRPARQGAAQRHDIHRLGQEVVHAGVEAGAAVVLVGVGGQGQDRGGDPIGPQ